MSDTTILEYFTLPSKGLLYTQKVNPEVKLRSMTCRDDMKILAPAKRGYEYKLMAEVIDDCLLTKPGISSYDMCIGDYQFLLFKLRTVSYGPDYKMQITCPNCFHTEDKVMNLDELEVVELKDDFDLSKYTEFELPSSKKRVKIKYETPRILDEIERDIAEFEKKIKDSDVSLNPRQKFTVMRLLDTVDGEKLSYTKLDSFVDKMPVRDIKYILSKIDKLNGKAGLGTLFKTECPECGLEHYVSFRFTSEFYQPTMDEE